jgi:hypothetical protein
MLHKSTTLDLAGATLSGACALHCLAVPALVAAAPVLGSGWLASELLETALLGMAVAVSAICAALGWRAHRRRRVPAAFALAAAVLLAGFAVGESGALGRALMVAGALGIAAAHLANRRLCRACAAGHD